jgi:cupin 2 domain-containing protein
MNSKDNLLSSLPDASREEVMHTLLQMKQCRVERIVSQGQCSPPDFWYDQATDEWVLLLAGEAELEYTDGSRHHLHPGDTLLIPAHCRHRVSFTHPQQPTVWLALHGILEDTTS